MNSKQTNIKVPGKIEWNIHETNKIERYSNTIFPNLFTIKENICREMCLTEQEHARRHGGKFYEGSNLNNKII